MDVIDLADLTALAKAADPAVSGCAVLKPDRDPEPGWVIATRADGTRVRIDGVAPDSPAVAVVLSADLSTMAVATRRLAAAPARAIGALLGSTDPATQGVVSLFRLAFTLINDGREARGLARLQEPELIQRAAALLPAFAPR
jgi:hypothetical protein